MSNELGYVLAAIGAAITGLLTYLLGRRNASGRINTSEAATLWTASEEIRRELRDEAVALRKRVGQLEDKNRALQRAVDDLTTQNRHLQRQMSDVTRRVNGGKDHD